MGGPVLRAEIMQSPLDRRWRYRVFNVHNGEPVVDVSEPYFSRWNARRAVKRLFPSLVKIENVTRWSG